MIVCARVYAQDKKDTCTFYLTGTVNGRDTGIIILGYTNIKEEFINDTTLLNKGKFCFTGKIPHPVYSTIMTSGKGNRTGMYIEPAKQSIILKEGDFNEFILSGSNTQKEQDTLRNIFKLINIEYKDWLDEADSVLKQYSKTKDSASRAKLNEQLLYLGKRNAIVYKAQLDEVIRFIKGHPDSYVSPDYLHVYLFNKTFSNDSIQTFFNEFSHRIKNSLSGRAIQEELMKRKGNIQAPSFSATDIHNKKIGLDDFKGKYVLLNFWASWCIPCIKEMPELKSFLKKYGSQGFEIITVSIDADKQNWIDAVKKNELEKFRNVLANDEIHKKYSNTRQPIPSMLLINRRGIIIWNSMSPAIGLSEILSKEFNGQ